MMTTELLFILLSFFVAAALKGVTGLGFSTICLPLLTLFIDHKMSIPLVLIPSLCSNVLVIMDAGEIRPAIRRFWPVIIAAVPGLLLGLWLLSSVESSTTRAVLGIVLFAYAVWTLAKGHLVLSEQTARWLAYPVGLLTGIINGVTGSQVMPVLPYLLSLNISKDLFVSTINIFFTVSSLIMLAGLSTIGLLDSNILLMSALGIVPVAIGIRLGGVLRKSLTDEIYKKLVLIFLMVIGLSLIIRI